MMVAMPFRITAGHLYPWAAGEKYKSRGLAILKILSGPLAAVLRSGMADKEPSFYDLMSKKLGGDDAFNAFMSEWGSTFKSGENWTVRRMPEASDYGN